MRVADLEQLMWDPATPTWAKQVIREVRNSDPVDALNVLEAIAAAIRQDQGFMPFDSSYGGLR